jgi:hypothetical protein
MEFPFYGFAIQWIIKHHAVNARNCSHFDCCVEVPVFKSCNFSQVKIFRICSFGILNLYHESTKHIICYVQGPAKQRPYCQARDQG